MADRGTELMLQGDREQALGLPISPLCDRKNTHVAQSQIGKFYSSVDARCLTHLMFNLESRKK